MQCHLLLGLSLFTTVYSLTLETRPTASVLVPTNVTWRRNEVDPMLFDLRFVHHDGNDTGLAATINATDGRLSGIVSVNFTTQGRFVLTAVDFERGNREIASSNMIFVHASAPAISVSVIGTSLQSAATASTATVTTTTGLPSSTGKSSTSTITEATHTPSSASSMSAANTAAVVGGVVGSVILILILAILFILRKRKDGKKRKRLTFKRDLMIKHRPLAPDIEEGHGVGTSSILPPLSFQQAITVPTPQGPVRSEFSASVSQTPVHTDPPTYRQVQLGAQIIQIERQMSSIRRQSRGQEGMETVLEHMKKQVEWLRAERDSPWARCETDVPPP
ncbi:hypothetical protein H2248_000019 [Termitomyces sp. 'cryptogamus']|nr:hypothetical protein H2248_000019 [Termitomyces sp. 'cryptogamus']